jgi:hypothetical protein
MISIYLQAPELEVEPEISAPCIVITESGKYLDYQFKLLLKRQCLFLTSGKTSTSFMSKKNLYNPRNSTFIPERAVTSPLAIVNLV